jgi:hypothetical protein
MDSLVVRRLRSKAVFKVLFLGLSVFFVPFFTVIGILASLDVLNFFWGTHQLTGLTAAFSGPFIGLFFSLMLGLFVSVFTCFGLMLFSKKAPIAIEYYPVASNENS